MLLDFAAQDIIVVNMSSLLLEELGHQKEDRPDQKPEEEIIHYILADIDETTNMWTY